MIDVGVGELANGDDEGVQTQHLFDCVAIGVRRPDGWTMLWHINGGRLEEDSDEYHHLVDAHGFDPINEIVTVRVPELVVRV